VGTRLERGTQVVTVRSVARHAAPALLEGTLIPLLLFTSLVHSLGLHPALWGSLLWSYSALARRAVVGRRIPGILVLSAVGVSFRLVTMVFTGSTFLFFFQPVLATVATAGVFAMSVVIGRPLVARLGADLVPVPETAWEDPSIRRLCRQLSVVWAVALLANAGLTVWMLTQLSVADFVLFRPLVSVVTTLPAVLASVLAGQALLRRSGTRLTALSAPALVVDVSPISLVALAT
jgi:intracellular septation protein A